MLLEKKIVIRVITHKFMDISTLFDRKSFRRIKNRNSRGKLQINIARTDDYLLIRRNLSFAMSTRRFEADNPD